MNYDVNRIREQYPSLSITDNGKPRIYLDNPAGTQVPASVAEAMSDCLLKANANLGGYFETSRRADAVVENAHAAAADLLNAASSDEIVFGQNMTTLTLHLSRSIAHLLNPGDEVLLTRMDHDANIQPWVLMAQDHGFKVRWLPFNTDTFEFDLDTAREKINKNTALICVGGASNLLGTLNDVKALCAMAKNVGAMSFVDAVQSVPHVATDVQDIGCDFLACSAYKYFGPHQGVLYGRREVLEKLTPYKVRPAPKAIPGCFETGTQSHEGMAGTAAAIDYLAAIGKQYGGDHLLKYPTFNDRRQQVHAAMDLLFDYEATLSGQLIGGLQSINGITVQGVADQNKMHRRVPTVAFTSAAHAPDYIARELGKQNIFVWSGHNYALEVVNALHLDDKGGVIRVGPVHYNTAAEIDVLLNAISDLH